MPGGLSYKREVDHYRVKSVQQPRAKLTARRRRKMRLRSTAVYTSWFCTQLNVFNDPLVLTNASNTKELWVSFGKNSEVATCSPRLLHTPLALASLLRHIATRLLLLLCPISLT